MDPEASDNQPIRVNCKPGQAVRINIEIVIGEADEILGGGGTGGTKRTVLVEPGGSSRAPDIPLRGQEVDPDTTPNRPTDDHPIGLA